jgi:HK97 family phage prohead protease
MHIEHRAAAAEIRAAGRRLTGHAAVFGVETRIGNFVEVVAAGAFTASLADGTDKLALVDHDPARVLARTRSGTLRLSEDQHGLAFTIEAPDTTLGRDVLALAERGDLGGMSFGFRVRPDGERWQGSRRELRSVDLVEVSIVSGFPAYPDTSVAARNRPAGIFPAPRNFRALARWRP